MALAEESDKPVGWYFDSVVIYYFFKPSKNEGRENN